MLKFIKNNLLMVLGILLAGVYFKDSIVGMASKVSPKLGEKLNNTKTT